MAAYINGIGTISPQHTFGDAPFLETPQEFTTNRLASKEPDYTNWIDAKGIRRMSRIIKMGVASASLALKEAGIEKPDAIITCTAFGCMEDTGIFITKMVENNEEALNPTPFIQSTHNTIGSQVALLFQCQGYNQTYSHRAFSFENALLDALIMIGENHDNILVGGVEEITNISYDLLNRFDLYKENLSSSLSLFESKTKGVIQGEGASFFLLSNKKTNVSYAKVIDIATFYKPESQAEIQTKILRFISHNAIEANDIDLILLGKDGDVDRDENYQSVAKKLFPTNALGAFKHLCGEYQTANSFALWLAAKILKENIVPSVVLQGDKPSALNRILIYNQYRGNHHSLILVESC